MLDHCVFINSGEAMKRNVLFVFVLTALAACLPATGQCGFIYQFTGLPAAPVTPGTEVQVQVFLAEFDTTIFTDGIIAASVQIAPVSGLVLNSITSGADWALSDFNTNTGYWDGSTEIDSKVTTNPVLLATYSFTANQTATFTAVDPLVLDEDGSAIDVNFNGHLIGSASATITVVPEPSTLFAWCSALLAVSGFSWVRIHRSWRRLRTQRA